MRHGKWISTVGFFVKLALLGIFLILVGIFVVSGAGEGLHVAVTYLIPTTWELVASSILPIVVVLWLGAEMPNSASEEIESAQRDVTRAVLRAGIIVIILHSLFLLAILIVLPTHQLSAVGSFLDAFQTVNLVLTTPLGMVGRAGLCSFAICLCCDDTHRRKPHIRHHSARSLSTDAFRILSGKFGTPIVSTIFSGMVATVRVVASIGLSAYGSESIERLFIQVLGVAISSALLAHLLMFPTFLFRYRSLSLCASQVQDARSARRRLDCDPFTNAICRYCLLFLALPKRCLSPEQSPGSADV
jgi:amino acid transporter